MKFDSRATGARLRYLRKGRGLTQDRIAAACQLTDKTGVAKVERGEQELKASQIMAICDYFECSPEFLLYGETPEVTNSDAYQQLIDAALKVPLSRIDEETRVLEARYGIPVSPPRASHQGAPPLDGTADSAPPDSDAP